MLPDILSAVSLLADTLSAISLLPDILLAVNLSPDVVVSEIEGYSYSLLYNRDVSTMVVLVVYRVITELLDVDTGIVLRDRSVRLADTY